MADFNTKQIRNVALMGHSGSGKTSLIESALYLSKATDRLGKISDGNTVCDYDAEEIKRGFTLSISLAPVTWGTSKINFIDTPGFLDFQGEVLEAVRVADAAVITLDSRNGIEVGAELAWEYASNAGIPKAFYINKFDDEESSFERTFTALHNEFGVSVCPVIVPIKANNQVIFVDLIQMKAYVYDNKGNRIEMEWAENFDEFSLKYKDILNEALAETSEELLDKYFETGEITKDEAVLALHEGIIQGTIVPVYSGAATKLWGVDLLLDAIDASFPRPTAKKNERIVAEGEEADKPIEVDGDTSIFVFKTVADPFVGKMSLFKVMNGSLSNDMTLVNGANGSSEKIAHIYTLRGKKQTEVTDLCCGDIGMIAKLANTFTNNTLTSGKEYEYAKITFPKPYMTKAIRPAAKGDEDKISNGVARILEEDPTLVYENNPETHEMTISGIGDIHLDVVVSKLKSRYGVTVVLDDPKIPYRETIKGTSDVEGKHKKQSGGSGQYGHVKIRFSHGEETGLTFITSVVGGTVPKNYYPAVQKGLEEAMEKGVLAGYPVVNLSADLYDGSYHPVDSNEISFKLAAKLAYKKGLPEAKPILLEPIGTLDVIVPDSLVGDVLGDLNKRRGRVLQMSPANSILGSYTDIQAEIPKAEMANYTITLRAMTQGRGKFDYTVDRYEEVPAAIAQKVIAESHVDEEQ